MHRSACSIQFQNRSFSAGLSIVTLAIALTVVPVLIGGCATGSASSTSSGGGDADKQAAQDLKAQRGNPTARPSDDEATIADAVQSQAQRLADAVARSAPPPDEQADRQPTARVQPTPQTRDAQGRQPATRSTAPSTQPGDQSPEDATPSDNDASDTATTVADEASHPTRDELVRMLQAKLRDADEPAMKRALTAATLSAAFNSGALDGAALQGLNESQRSRVDRYYQFLLATMNQLATGDSNFERDVLHQRIDTFFEPEPIDIRKLVLCRSVTSYGVYEAYADHVFLAGGKHRLLVYVELDHFRTSEADDGRYEVKLQQQVTLYNESDGLAVWRQDPVQIVDVSRNRRRDFFIVQLIELPARLGVGKYRLKVRVTDEHGGSLDETTTPVRLVADEELVRDE